MEQIDIKLIGSDQNVKQEVLEVYEYLKIYKDATARVDWLERRKKAWDCIENNMWEPGEEAEMKAMGQIPFVVNRCVKGVQASGAILTNQKPQMMFSPVGSSDLYVAELIKRGFDVIWDKNEGNDVVYDVYEERNVGGIGFVKVDLDKSKDPFGAITFTEDPPDDVYFDKESRSRDFSDTNLIRAKLRTLEYIREHYPDIPDEELFFMPTTKEDGQKSSGVEGEDNYTIASEPDSIDPDTKAKQKMIWEIEAWLLKVDKQEWALGQDKESGRPRSRQLEKGEKLADGEEAWPRRMKKRVQRIIVGKKLVSEKENPLGLDSDNEPIVPLIGMKAQRTRSAYPMSKTSYAREINREKNKRRIQAIHAASYELNSPIWYTDGVTWSPAGQNPGTPGTSARVSKNAPANPIGRLSAGSSNIAALITLEEKSDAEIDDIYDTHDVMRGKLPKDGGSQLSGRLVLALQDMGGMMSGPDLRRMESALVRLTKAIVSLMLTRWPRNMWERLLETEEKLKAPEQSGEAQLAEEMERAKAIGEAPPAESEEDQLDRMIAENYAAAIDRIGPAGEEAPPDGGLGMIDIDVKVHAGSSLPTNRMAKGQLAIEYVNAGVYDPQAALEYIDDPNKDRIIARMERRQQAEAEAALLSGRR